MNEKQLISFGNYMLQRREKGFISEQNQHNVTHADLENWKHENV